MEEWLDIIAGKLRDEKKPLPLDDWYRLEKEYLSHKRDRWFYPLTISFATAAALAFIVFNYTAEKQIIDNNDSSNSVSVLSASNDWIEIIENIVEERVPVMINNKGIEEYAQEIISEIPKPPTEESVSAVTEDEGYKEEPKVINEQKVIIDIIEPETQVPRKKIIIASRLGGFNSKEVGDNYLPGPGSTSFAEVVNHSVPVTVGLDISYPLNDRLSLTSGLETSLYKTTFRYLNDTGEFDTVNQKAWYIGIPLTLDYTLWQEWRLSTWVGAGGKIDHCIYARRNGVRLRDNSYNWSVLTYAGIRYDLSDHIGVYFAPEGTWYLKPQNTRLSTYRTDNPLMFTVNTGIRFTF